MNKCMLYRDPNISHMDKGWRQELKEIVLEMSGYPHFVQS
jgi:hypothetical protein